MKITFTMDARDLLDSNISTMTVATWKLFDEFVPLHQKRGMLELLEQASISIIDCVKHMREEMFTLKVINTEVKNAKKRSQ